MPPPFFPGQPPLATQTTSPTAHPPAPTLLNCTRILVSHRMIALTQHPLFPLMTSPRILSNVLVERFLCHVSKSGLSTADSSTQGSATNSFPLDSLRPIGPIYPPGHPRNGICFPLSDTPRLSPGSQRPPGAPSRKSFFLDVFLSFDPRSAPFSRVTPDTRSYRSAF